MRCDEMDDDSNTALHAVCRQGLYNAVKWMFECGAFDPEHIHRCNTEGYPPLFLGVMGGDSENYLQIVDHLISQGADVNYEMDYVDEAQGSALGIAMCEEYTNMLNLLIDGGADIHREMSFNIDDEGTSALHLACHIGYLDGVITLVAAGANVNPTEDSNCESPLFYAIRARKNAYEITKYLLENGADCETIDTSVIFDVCRFRDIKMLGLLLEHGAHPDTSCFLAVFDSTSLEASRDMGLYLLDNVPHLTANTTDDNGTTPLMAACRTHNYELAGQLITQYGANVHAADYNKKTSLVHALDHWFRFNQEHKLKTLRVLLSHNASLLVTWYISIWKRTVTPISFEILRENYSSAQFLIRFSNDRHWVESVQLEQLHNRTNTNAKEFCAFLDDWLSTVPTLQGCCRSKIRCIMGPNLVKHVQCLPLPDAVKDYIMIPEVQDDECVQQYYSSD